MGNQPSSENPRHPSPFSPGDRESIRSEFQRTRDPDRILQWRSALVDRLVIESWREHLEPFHPKGLAVLAVGGFGRRHLFPFSDVDLLFLFEREEDAQASRDTLSACLQTLWDAGLRVSQSVRIPSECVELHERNVELNISLLDVRYLAGDVMLAERVAEKLPRFVQGQRQQLIRNLSRLTAERHQRYGGAIYHLEPNVKDGPGGIRDYQVLTWLSRIRSADARRIPEADLSELETARRLLFSIRCLLHYQAGRDSNVLSFDAQEAAAEIGGSPNPSAYMREYFRQARQVHRATMNLLEAAESQPGSSLFAHLLDRRSRLSNADFSVVKERVYLRVPQQIELDPAVVLRLFAFVARHGIRLSQDCRQRLGAHRGAIRAHYRRQGSFWEPLREALALPHTVLALREMHETSVLFDLFPEMEQIDCLVIRDFYHRYTVDEHSLVAIQTLLELNPDGDGKGRPFAEILSEVDRPDLIVFALLFHDVGKSSAAEGHVEASLWLAECAMERIAMPVEDRETVRFLIREHLTLSATLQSRDLSEPSTVAGVASRIGTVERLRALTLVTYCDISAVNPNAMTPWRATELIRLFRLVDRELTLELDSDRITDRPADRAELAAFLSGFPRRYILTHSRQEVEEHFEMARHLEARGAAVSLVRKHEVFHLTVLAKDRPFLFATLAGTLSGTGMNILKAEAFSNRRGEVLDTFVFADPNRNLDLNPSEVERLAALVEKAALGKLDVKRLLGNRPPPAAVSRGGRIRPRVVFDADASPSATLVQIISQDRPGLLHDLASVFSTAGCNIEVVLIDTEAHKAIDVFFVTKDGVKITDELRETLERELSQVCRPDANSKSPLLTRH